MTGKKCKRTFFRTPERKCILRDKSTDAMSDSSNSSTVEKLLNLFDITLTPDPFDSSEFKMIF